MAACRWRPRSTHSTPRPRPTCGTSPPTPKATFTPPLDHRRACTRSRPTARRASFSRPRNCRCRRWRLMAAARSTPRRRPTARCTRSFMADRRPAKRRRHAHCAEGCQAQVRRRRERRDLRSPSIPATAPACFFDPKTKYIWTLALDKQGRLYIGTGDRGEIFRVDTERERAQCSSRAMKPRFACWTSTRRAT